MARTVTCTCGYVLRANSDEELYTLMRRHIIPMECEAHRPTRGAAWGKDLRGPRRVVAPLRRMYA